MQISKQPITWQHLNAFKLKVQNIQNHLFISLIDDHIVCFERHRSVRLPHFVKAVPYFWQF